MKIKIHYRPMIVDVPDWAADDIRKAIARGRMSTGERELLDELHEHEGWAPAIASIESRGK